MMTLRVMIAVVVLLVAAGAVMTAAERAEQRARIAAVEVRR